MPVISPPPGRRLEKNWECGVRSLSDEKKNFVANHNAIGRSEEKDQDPSI